jgi:flagellar motor switch protein FliN/FliY
MADEETTQTVPTPADSPAVAEAAPEAATGAAPEATTAQPAESAATVAEAAPDVAEPPPLFTEFAPPAAVESPFSLGPQLSPEIRRILRVAVPVIVKLADKRLSLGDIIDVSPGSIIEFAKSAEQPLELLVNNQAIGRGIAVKVGEKFGLRIDQILPREETIRSFG